MPLELVTIPCLEDNYAFLLVNDRGQAALIDVPEAAPINAELARCDLELTDVLLTHHHWDHIDGLPDLDMPESARVIGAKADAHRLPPLHLAVGEGDTIDVLGEDVRIFDVSGHTVGHIAFCFEDAGFAFTGDSLMALGCGRLFEGTPQQMHKSLQKLATLPEDTLICSGHEYTASNGRFAASVDSSNAKLKERNAQTEALRRSGKFTVPSTLELELETNPFMRTNDPAIRAHLGMASSSDAEVFTKLRSLKDTF